MFKNFFKAPVDYTEELDKLQFAREAYRKGIAHLPEDSSTWTEKHWAVHDHWDAQVPTMDNPPCVVRGVVTSREGAEFRTVCVRLDPPPRNKALPKELEIMAVFRKHRVVDFNKFGQMAIGDHVEIQGIFYPPIMYVEPGWSGIWFRLKEA